MRFEYIFFDHKSKFRARAAGQLCVLEQAAGTNGLLLPEFPAKYPQMTTIPDTSRCLILAADIGGTNSRFALFRSEPDNEGVPLLSLLREKWLSGADYPDFPAALAALRVATPEGPPLLRGPECGQDYDPDCGPEYGPEYSLSGAAEEGLALCAVIAPAGPIQGESCRISNLPWLVRARDVRDALGAANVALINDFAAQAYACLIPERIAPYSVLEGRPDPDVPADAPVAVVGAGTGFGQALLLRPAPPLGGESRPALLRRLRQARVLASEGGHADFPFSGPRENAFAGFAAARYGLSRLIGDNVVSGPGLAHLLAFLTGRDLCPREAARVAPEHPEVMEWFARFYGRACRQYVLHTLALGGLYITGGMALRVPVLDHPAFAAAFLDSAIQRPLLESVPVQHIREPQAGLWGAALYGLLHVPPKPEPKP